MCACTYTYTHTHTHTHTLAGLGIYAITKGVGHEITRVFAENHRQQLRVLNVVIIHALGDWAISLTSRCVPFSLFPFAHGGYNIKVLRQTNCNCIPQIFNGFYNPEPSSERRFDGTGAPGGDTQVMAVSWIDAGRLLRRFSLEKRP